MPKPQTLPNVMLAVLAVASLLATGSIIALVLLQGPPARAGADAAIETGPLPVIYDLPRFDLIDQDGQPFGSRDLEGKVYVADFMFTRCNGICPMMSRNMQLIQESLQADPRWGDIRLVSISVDAEHDTPATLREYAQRFKAEPGQWVFLTGERDTVWTLSREGFRLGVDDQPDDPIMPISHSGRLVLVDGQGRVRAYHDGTTAEGRRAMIADVHRLLEE